MALNIDDFKQTSLTVDDFGVQPPQAKTLNERSANLVAATSTALDGGTPEDFEAKKAQLLDPYQEQLVREQAQARQNALWENYITPGIPEIITDPNMPVEKKDQLISVATTAPTDRISFTDTQMLAFQAARAPLEEDATEAAEAAVYNFVDDIRQVDTDKMNRQKAINSLALTQDQTTMGMIGDVAELMAPFAEWINTDQLLKDLTGKGAVDRGGLLGSQKAALYDMIEQIPYDKRAEFTETVLEIVQNTSRVAIQDTNSLVALDNLNRMLIDNDYSNTEYWIDQATSVLDIIGVGSLAKGVFTGGKGAKVVVEAGTKSNAIVEGATKAEQTGTDVMRVVEGEVLPTQEALGPPAPKQLEGPVIEGDYVVMDETLPPKPRPTALLESEKMRKARIESTRSDVSPASPSQIVKDANPKTAREMHKAVDEDPTGKAAEALYGASREEALAKDILPEPELTRGAVPHKVEMKPQYTEDFTANRARLTNGQTAISTSELDKVVARIDAGFRKISKVVMHPSSLVVRTNADQTIGITARYSPLDSGYETWSDALAEADFVFKDYGLPSEAFVPLVRRGDEWVETTVADINAKNALKAAGLKETGLKDIEYAVGIKHDYAFRPEDLEIDSLLTSSPSWAARTLHKLDKATGHIGSQLYQGSFVQNWLDPASAIAHQFVNPAHVAYDRAVGLRKVYSELFQDFIKDYKTLNKARRGAMAGYIREANIDGIPFSPVDLRARGFSEKEIDALRQWRRANDTMWYATNADMVKTLRARGNKVYVHAGSDTKFIGRPISKEAVRDSKIFDSVDNVNLTMDKTQLEEFYNSGGEIIKLAEPTKIDGEWVEFIKSRNTQQGGYTRALYDEEIVVPYRDGYYPAIHDSNYFIYKTMKGERGETFEKVVGSARDTKEREDLLAKFRREDPEGEYGQRADRRVKGGDNLFDDNSWSTITNGGLSSQRMRGKPLATVSDAYKATSAHLRDPLEAVAQQVHQLANRVGVRDYMNTAKNRWMQNYADHLELPIDPKTHLPRFPEKITEIVGKSGGDPRFVDDAQMNFNYLNSLENGYINYIDEFYRSVMHSAAQFAGEHGFNGVERALFNSSALSPIQTGKTAAFKLFIALSPLRQGVIQRGQMIQLAAVNPAYALSEMVPDMSRIRMVRMGLTKDKKAVALYDEMKNAGILEAVDANTLLRQDAMHLADLSVLRKIGAAFNKPIQLSQKIGFDAAEEDVLTSAWLTFRDLAIKAGKDPKNQRVQDEILAQARTYTGGMNRAGDLAYSQNTFSLMTQFFSFRHKMLLQPLTNRNLTGMQRAKLTAYNTALFGVDATLVTYVLDQIYGVEGQGQQSPERDLLEQGLVTTGLNAAATAVTGEKQAIDWGDFAPTEAYGIGNVLLGVLNSGGLVEAIAASPSGSLLFGQSPRITDAFKTATRYFVPFEDYDEPGLETNFTDVSKAFIQMMSGGSAFFKAQYALHARKKMSASGNISDEQVTAFESYMALAGFQTLDETGYRKAYEAIYGTKQKTYDGAKGDVQLWYKELKRHLARKNLSTTEIEMTGRIFSEAWRVWGDTRPAAMEIISAEIEKDAQSGDYMFLKGMMSQAGLLTEEETWKLINKLPPGEARDKLETMMTFTYKDKE